MRLQKTLFWSLISTTGSSEAAARGFAILWARRKLRCWGTVSLKVGIMPFLADRFENLLHNRPRSIGFAAGYTVAAFVAATFLIGQIEQASERYISGLNLSPLANKKPFDGRFGGYSVQ